MSQQALLQVQIPTLDGVIASDLLRVALNYELGRLERCARLWRRRPSRINLEFIPSTSGLAVRLVGGRGFRQVLLERRAPGLPIPAFGDDVRWAIYRGRCWWNFARRKGCRRCHREPCICLIVQAERAEQLELTAWMKARGHFE